MTMMMEKRKGRINSERQRWRSCMVVFWCFGVWCMVLKLAGYRLSEKQNQRKNNEKVGSGEGQRQRGELCPQCVCVFAGERMVEREEG
jgi:hypothetical protein